MWEFGERYNSAGEFNPRLIPCENCEEYHEPEHLAQWGGWCHDCDNQEEGN
jgi:hypothetical protein